jgi:hypothetical protein
LDAATWLMVPEKSVSVGAIVAERVIVPPRDLKRA